MPGAGTRRRRRKRDHNGRGSRGRGAIRFLSRGGAGECWIVSSQAQAMASPTNRSLPRWRSARAAQITPAEERVLKGICRGGSNRAIAAN
ncbi:MAG: hypothetical protein ACK56F_10910, partial [bacterium]